MSERDGSDDAGDGDSGIDKEALREELREKYERDERERESTRRMSDLLLKGATMTNAHCGTCGDPLFTQNGTTFCPSCHGGPEGVDGPDLEGESDATTAGTDEPAAGTDRSETGASHDRPAETERMASGDEGVDTSSTPASPSETADSGSVATGSTDDDAELTLGTDRIASGTHRSADSSTPDRDPTGRTPDRRVDDRPPARPDDTLASARANLERALEKFAAEAAAADDPRYARDCLAAAREAGEALETVR
ncbi:Sjogren's syndrome/scleroderma autoantigen 1 family protein [Natrarchaeobaculum aegyptiacum]|uniref:Cytochrome c domain-containing protein n=1 Tax=Natrarchaeobaculum aegyptiacum TaxID=745377 RepID=A0A2Z2I3B2_9EURY|nr:Sjogren's syndrome/scleroderma autoantigen 1 family protein [Natrarchaeobaculum aegyptiacum]ARS91748.1 hypothetical protein B1756_08375 [Natrarchaeobaculum aegyptiacum]